MSIDVLLLRILFIYPVNAKDVTFLVYWLSILSIHWLVDRLCFVDRFSLEGFIDQLSDFVEWSICCSASLFYIVKGESKPHLTTILKRYMEFTCSASAYLTDGTGSIMLCVCSCPSGQWRLSQLVCRQFLVYVDYIINLGSRVTD